MKCYFDLLSGQSASLIQVEVKECSCEHQSYEMNSYRVHYPLLIPFLKTCINFPFPPFSVSVLVLFSCFPALFGLAAWSNKKNGTKKVLI